MTDNEQRLLQALIDRLPSTDRDQAAEDLSRASVRPETADGSRLVFMIAGYVRSAYQGQHPLPIEARMLDADGAEISVVLYADENGRLLELEYVRWGGGALLDPQVDSLRVW